MENRGIKIPNSEIVYIIQIPETASQDQVDYKDAIIMQFDKAYSKLRAELDTAKNSLAVSESVLFKCRTDYNMVNCRNGELKAELDASQKAVDEARAGYERISTTSRWEVSAEDIAKRWLTAHPKEQKPYDEDLSNAEYLKQTDEKTKGVK